MRLLDAVDVIAGVSGGSFTALAYGLYGDKLFADYEQRFLKRNVQGELLARVVNPAQLGQTVVDGLGPFELAAEFYDEFLFNGATYGDLDRGEVRSHGVDHRHLDRRPGASLHQTDLQSDVLGPRWRAAVPRRRRIVGGAGVLSPVTINNYGGTCNFCAVWVELFTNAENPPRPAAARSASSKDARPFADGAHRPYIHLVDGGVADNVGMRGVLDALDEFLEALHDAGMPTPLDHVKQIIVFIVNSLSSPPPNWDESDAPPGTVDVLLKATGVPIDHYSYEAVELMKDIAARWEMDGRPCLGRLLANKDSPICTAVQFRWGRFMRSTCRSRRWPTRRNANT